MAIMADLFALSKAYPIISIIVAVILFFIGLRVAGRLLKWIFWGLAIAAVAAAIYMLFA